jgi:lysophospholipase
MKNLKNVGTLAVLSLMTLPSFALEEGLVKNTMIELMNSQRKCESTGEDHWKREFVKTPTIAFGTKLDYKLRYSRFGCDLGKKGAMVIAPGRSEASPEYYETAEDFIKKGYSPVYVIDHRGQGLSPRLLKNTFKGHVGPFENYISDFDRATDAIVGDLEARGFEKGSPLVFTSNSMGGAIGLGYFSMKAKKSPYTAAILNGPMLRVNYLSFVYKKPSVINNSIYSEQGVITQSFAKCKLGKCGEYARESVFGDYKPASRNYVQLPTETEMEVYMTHSKARYDLKTYIWNEFDWSEIQKNEYDSNENWKNPQLGGSTNSWTLYVTTFLRKMRKKKFLKNLPNMPIMIQTGTRDLRAYRPYANGSTDLSRHSDVCDTINKANKYSKKLCKFMPIEEGFHELYKESDEYRDVVIQNLVDFVEKK